MLNIWIFFTVIALISFCYFLLHTSTFRKYLNLNVTGAHSNGITIYLKHQQTENRNKKTSFVWILFDLSLWIKLRLIYYANNWIYTTNHKRIAVNYYWFVIFAGICGMILATIIRLEMAYPGVGVLAGDSLQYLSVVTAHAVIMVFFMIMPLLFGAFGNFLLPTQLGVHDVAFPRLNSAAFWFLPAGLLMLVQLVCLDRRYQRMNCYNIREIQTILKSKYSPNTAESSDVRFGLEETIIGLRFQLNGIEFIDPSFTLFYKNALLNNVKLTSLHTFLNKPILTVNGTHNFMNKTSLTFQHVTDWTNHNINNLIFDSNFSGVATSIWNFLTPRIMLNESTSIIQNLIIYIKSFYSIFSVNRIFSNTILNLDFIIESLRSIIRPGFFTIRSFFEGFLEFCTYIVYLPISLCTSFMGSITRFIDITSNFTKTFTNSLIFDYCANSYLHILKFLMSKLNIQTSSNSNEQLLKYDTTYQTNTLNIHESPMSSLHEQLNDQRFTRTMNPIFKYDFKVGNYLPDELKKLNLHLFMTIHDVTTGVRKTSWFISPDYFTLLKGNIASHMLYFSNPTSYGANISKLITACSDADSTFSLNSPHSANVTPSGAFYNFLFAWNVSNNPLSAQWISINALDQKFYKMFATSSMQQRINANWRSLKFTREAWRCKLLAARHQNTLYRRYLNEDSVVWAVERNAKDVLPGWAMITPFSARTRFTAIGKVDIGLMGVFLVLNSSIVSSANFLVTYRYLSTLNNRKMRDARSFFTEGVMVASWMMIAANPMLAIGILMLLSDRHWQTSFFDYSGGGDTVLFQHMFWFFGHPEVYVIMIPAFGFNNTILSFYLRKRVSARASLLYSMYTIAFLGFFVWGHHMYMVGLAHTTRMLFSTLTVMISIPAATKLMHWCVTLVNSAFIIELPMVFQLLFIFFFVSGGISGMAVAHTGMDILFHDSFYVVGHFHVMLAGSGMFASFGAFYFYFPAIFGVKYSRIYGYLHCIYYLIGQLMTVVPMFWLGYAAMPRRVLDYPAALGGWHAIVSAGHMLSVAGMAAFFIMIFDSIRQGRAATRNSFGVARFNTRLNFYIYEGARTWFLQRKGWYLSRYNRVLKRRLNNLNYTNNEYLETTLYSYTILKNNSK